MNYRGKRLFFGVLFLTFAAGQSLAQHDPQRDAVRLIARDRYTKAEERLAGHPDNPETEFVLALMHSREGDAEAAVEHARRALQAGLPIDRFVFGPPGALGTLTGTEVFAQWLTEKPSSILQGPMVGSVTDTSARIWVRTPGEALVAITVFPLGESENGIRSERVASGPDTGYVATPLVRGLSPGTEHRYVVAVDGRTGPECEGRFRTFPHEGSPARFSVGCGGGAGYVPRHEHMWNVIAGRRPVAFLMLGDNVYIDDPQHRLTQEYCYRRRQARPEWQQFASSTAVYAIWDDHDFGTNDCNSTLAPDDPPWKPDVLEVFKQNWVNPSYGSPERPGIWFDFHIGDVHFIMLDCRFYRTRPGLKNPTMLGPHQLRWLKQKLHTSEATFKVVASSVPWAEGTKPGSRDTWDGYPGEREEIFRFIRENRVEGVVLLSADRHRSDAWRIPRPDAYDLYDLESSKLTNRHTHREFEQAIFSYNSKCSFGLLDFDTTQQDPQLTYRVVNIDNEVVHTLVLKKSRLSFD